MHTRTPTYLHKHAFVHVCAHTHKWTNAHTITFVHAFTLIIRKHKFEAWCSHLRSIKISWSWLGCAQATLNPSSHPQAFFDLVVLHKSSSFISKTLIGWWTLIGSLAYSSGHPWTPTLVPWSLVACTSHHLLCALALLLSNPNIQLLVMRQPCETHSKTPHAPKS